MTEIYYPDLYAKLVAAAEQSAAPLDIGDVGRVFEVNTNGKAYRRLEGLVKLGYDLPLLNIRHYGRYRLWATQIAEAQDAGKLEAETSYYKINLAVWPDVCAKTAMTRVKALVRADMLPPQVTIISRDRASGTPRDSADEWIDIYFDKNNGSSVHRKCPRCGQVYLACEYCCEDADPGGKYNPKTGEGKCSADDADVWCQHCGYDNLDPDALGPFVRRAYDRREVRAR